MSSDAEIGEGLDHLMMVLLEQQPFQNVPLKRGWERKTEKFAWTKIPSGLQRWLQEYYDTRGDSFVFHGRRYKMVKDRGKLRQVVRYTHWSMS